jgi:type II secretion system protein D
LAGTAVILLGGTLWLVGQEGRNVGEQSFVLRHAQAHNIATPLQRVLQATDASVEVEVDQSRNRLVVRGSDAVRRVAQQLIETLDQPGSGAKPTTLIRSYPVEAARLAEVVKDLRAAYQRESQVRITADERTGQILVVAPESIHQQIAQRLAPRGQGAPELAPATVESPGRPSISDTGELGRISVTLRRLTWQELESYLKETWGEKLELQGVSSERLATFQLDLGTARTTLQVDRLQNVVHVFGPRAQLGAWRQMLLLLDDVTPGRQTAQLVSLKFAEPARVQEAVSKLRAVAERFGNPETTTAIRVADLGQTAVQEQPPAAQGNQPMAGQPPPGETPGRPPASETPGQPPAEPGAEEAEALLQNVRVEFIPELGVVVVIGPRRAVERVRRIIDEIETIGRTIQPTFEVVALQHLNSQATATLLVELYDRVFAPRQGPLSITSLDKPNALLLIGRRETIDIILPLIQKLDEPVPPETQLRVFRLKHISAVDAEALVRGFFVDRPSGPAPVGAAGQQERPLRPALGTRARVIAEYRTNSLIVQASPRDLAEVAYFIQNIDREAPDATHEVRVFRLRNARAQDLAPVLQGAITGRPVQVPGQAAAQQPTVPGQAGVGQAGVQVTAPSTRLAIVGIDAAGNRRIDSGVLTDVTVSADVSINALIVRAPSRSMGLVEELIKQLDQPPIAEAVIKVFEIANGDASSLTQMLQTLFGLPTTAQGLGGIAGALTQAPGAAFAVTAAAAGESSLVPLRFAVDVRTNSIVASGTSSDLAVVEAILLRLDASDVSARRMFVYRLLNAPATDTATAISNFLQQQRAIYQQNLLFNQTVSQIEQLEREIIVVPEAITNSLIVSVTPRYYDQIMEIIRALDFRPPMVMVQVMIAEVQLKDAFEFGVELGLQDSLLFDRSVAAGSRLVPNTNPLNVTAAEGTLAGQVFSGFGVGRTSASLGYGGLVLSAANESINILVRALQDAGRLQVLSRPSVMTLDSQPAFVQVGARVPRITGATITGQGLIQNQVQDADVGILLRIQPRVNQDGLIVMIIDAEKSEVGPREQGIPVAVDQQGNPVLSPQINTTTAQATISAYSGQTAVFAGLITKNRSVTSKRIPFLSDIPLVGRLFRFDAEVDQRTELLIFLTPYVVKDDHDYEFIKQVESQRMSWCLADVVEVHGNVGLSGGHGLWGPATIPMIFPDLDPTGHEAVPAPSPTPAPSPPPAPQMVPPEAAQPSGDQQSSSRRGARVTSVRTWLGPKPAPRVAVPPPEASGSSVPTNGAASAPMPAGPELTPPQAGPQAAAGTGPQTPNAPQAGTHPWPAPPPGGAPSGPPGYVLPAGYQLPPP